MNETTTASSLSSIFAWDCIYQAFPWFWWIFAFFVGAFAASFWGVLVYRLPVVFNVPFTEYSRNLIAKATDEDKTLLNRSHCDSCGRKLTWLNLMPVIGYLLSRGKCSNCHSRIPVVYPIMEGVTGSLCALGLFVTHGSLLIVPFIAWMILIAWMDDRTQWIPDGFTMPTIATGLLVALCGLSPVTLESSVAGMLTGYALIFLAFALISLLKQDNYMNYGDMFLFAGIGAWVGIGAMPYLLGGTALMGIPYVLFCKIRHKYGLAKIEYVKGQENASSTQGDDGQVGIPMGPLMSICAILLVVLTLCVGHSLSVMAIIE